MDLDVVGIGVRGLGDAEGRGLHLAQHVRRGLVVGIDHRVPDVEGREELLLRPAVGLHRAEVVQVILREIGEHALIELHTHQLAQIQRMRRDLHYIEVAACVAHSGQQRLHVDGIRRSQAGRLLLVSDKGAHRAHQPHLVARVPRDFAHEEGCGGLALGARDAHALHAARRVAVEALRHVAHGGSGVLHQHLRHIDGQLALHHQRHAAVAHRLGREIMRVEPLSRNAEEQAVLHLILALTGHIPDLDVQITPGFKQIRHAHYQL